MNYEHSNYHPGYCPNCMMQQQQQQQQQQQVLPANQMGMFPGFSGPTYGVATVPLGGVREQSFIENILRFNKGKVGTFYFTYQGNSEWNAKIYHGRVETAGRDHIIISDPDTGRRYLLLMANLDWVEFDERIMYPFEEINPEIQQSLTSTE